MKDNQEESMNPDIYQQQQLNQQQDIQNLLSTGFDFNQSLQQPGDQIDANTYLDTCSDSLMHHFIQDHSLFVQQHNTDSDAYLNILNDASTPTLNLMPPSSASNVTNANTKEDSDHQQDQPKVRGEQDVFNELLQMAATASANNTNSNTLWLNEYNVNPLEDSAFITKNDESQFFDDSFLSSRTNKIHLKPLESNMSNIQGVNTPLTSIENDRTFDVSFLVVTCDAYQDFGNSDTDENLKNVKPKIDTIPTVAIDEGGREQYCAVRMRSLAGATVASAEKLYDLDGNLGIFFIFQDVSLRIEGSFRLEFSLVDIEEPPFLHCVNTKSASPVLKTIETKPFKSYTPKNFPGVVQSTPLSECFARQGIKIPVRKDKAKKQNKKVFSTAQFLSDMDKDC
ncbi:hypothetical protein MAM1_0249d08707 [Mucor ambiguus]|uniref:Velvet domain-containing protein n=1 Tax=Mucor ambiguus TaxID=91626 RepID=A0A0C9LWV5_9FUNG|nr:hypothetical protein MAM1_0249d08707 [Mucor ambiguus]